MSERVANAEIEDVLLSIRRLVQGDAGGSAGEGGFARRDTKPFADPDPEAFAERQDDVEEEHVFDEPARPKPAAEALVLTPALRVDDVSREPAAESQRPDDELHFEPEDPPLDSPPAGARLHFEVPDSEDLDDFAEGEWAVDPEDSPEIEQERRPFAWSDEAAGGAPEDATGVPSFVRAVVGDLTHLREAQEKGREPEPVEPLSASDEDPATDEDVAEAAPWLEKRAAPKSGFRFGWEEEAGVRNLVPLHDRDGDRQADLPNLSDPSADDSLSTEGDDVPGAEGQDDDLPGNDLLSSIVSTFDAMEESFAEEKAAEFAENWRDEAEGETEASETGAPEEEVAPVEAEADVVMPDERIDDLTEVAAAVETTPEEPVSDPETHDEAAGFVLDEAILSDLIAECVHRELQGELGERITRNVRKLVRREIHRALAMRDFD
ncbi:hypothetical protein [Tropicimonas sediminicola]|uniref:Uncharacterized protein n=1 Tax=Tropicimonas sediminicola TaxID=1031541 RepID=A0A239KGV9_9RHOB|nr:hypothetical protein [Tropicimonas sediminicola]SNT16932.1 hypothetical protein SAMN05421757_10781 [Tropicimonas sediminicola]